MATLHLLALLLNLWSPLPAGKPADSVWLSPTPYITKDTSHYVSYRLHIYTSGDSSLTIHRIQPSCGCILASVQRSIATKDHPGEIYVAINTEKLDSLQPVTIDIETIPPKPELRAFIFKYNAE
jgi:hypothetical protein